MYRCPAVSSLYRRQGSLSSLELEVMTSLSLVTGMSVSGQLIQELFDFGLLRSRLLPGVCA